MAVPAVPVATALFSNAKLFPNNIRVGSNMVIATVIIPHYHHCHHHYHYVYWLQEWLDFESALRSQDQENALESRDVLVHYIMIEVQD